MNLGLNSALELGRAVFGAFAPTLEPGDYLAPERPEGYFEAGDFVTYEARPGIEYEAFVEKVDYADSSAFIAYYIPALDDFCTAWRPLDMLTLNEEFQYNVIENATAA